MIRGRRSRISAARAAWMRTALAVFAVLFFFAASGVALAQTSAPPAKAADDTPPQVRALLNLLSDPAVRDWLDKQQAQRKPVAPAEPAAQDQSASGFLAARIGLVRQHMAELVATVPKLPGELADAVNILLLEFEESGLFRMLLLIAGFIALGFGAEWGFYWIAAGVEKWIIALR